MCVCTLLHVIWRDRMRILHLKDCTSDACMCIWVHVASTNIMHRAASPCSLCACMVWHNVYFASNGAFNLQIRMGPLGKHLAVKYILHYMHDLPCCQLTQLCTPCRAFSLRFRQSRPLLQSHYCGIPTNQTHPDWLEMILR